MFIENSLMRQSIMERLTQLHYIEININDSDFSRRLFSFDLDYKWETPYVHFFIKPYNSYTTCIMLVSDEGWTDHAKSEDELCAFQSYVEEELGTYYYNLKLLTVVVSDNACRHLASNKNTVAIRDGKIYKKTSVDIDLRSELKVISTCYNYARAKKMRNEVLDSFYGGYKVVATYWICMLMVASFFMTNKLNLKPLEWDSVLSYKKFYTLITYLFMHNGILHLVGNLAGIIVVGRALESKIGLKKFVLVFFGSGILSGVASALYKIDSLDYSATVGCSGAVFGLIGAWVVVSSYDFNYRDLNVTNLITSLIVSIGYLFLCSRNENVDNPAHIAGFIFGIATIIAIECIESIAEDEKLILSDAYIRKREDKFEYFNRPLVEKTLVTEKEREGKEHDVSRDNKSRWIRF